ncbi:MAG: DUF805 domain-containing protein [Bacteroidota bacterium]
MINYYIDAFKKYATFSGRAQRKEYWTCKAVFFGGLCFFSLLLVFFSRNVSAYPWILGAMAIYVLLNFLPMLAVSARRLHDTGRSGWWLLLPIFPPGWIVIFIFNLMDSDPNDNRYGPCPKKKVSTKK